jgi:uncharacterized membrane protein YgaE (UPF0421/DUF939 family)
MGIRVIKTAVATIIAIYVAAACGLENFLSAGLLAILGVEVTKRRGLISALQRISASVLALLLAVFIFFLFGFHVWALSLFILIAYPLLAKVKLKDGIVTGTVAVLHLFGAKSVELSIILNEICLLMVGFGVATLVNIVYMPRFDQKLEGLRREVEELFSVIFQKIALHLRDQDTIWDGEELIAAHNVIKQGADLAQQVAENTLFREEEEWRHYFRVRRRQLESIQRMIGLIAQVYQRLPHGEMVAQLFDKISEEVKAAYYTGETERHLIELEQRFKVMPLPATRDEFEVRSALLQLLVELKYYLSIAKKEKAKTPQQNAAKKFLSL